MELLSRAGLEGIAEIAIIADIARDWKANLITDWQMMWQLSRH
ncbi:MAG TPA: hypothetical protein VGH51_05480 [Candidatus Angelobacter sp.]|jgi:hypothetical protein